MNSDDAVLSVIDALEACDIPYMLVGSFSVNCYAPPRNTQDADFVIQLGDRGVQELSARLGPAIRMAPQMGFETITATMRYLLRVEESFFKIELFELSDEEHDQARFARRTPVEVAGRTTMAATPEDVIITKLRWSKRGQRSKDIDDARNVIRMQARRLDWDYLREWTDRHGTRDLLDALVDQLRDIGAIDSP